jgi:hypothetical protein
LSAYLCCTKPKFRSFESEDPVSGGKLLFHTGQGGKV